MHCLATLHAPAFLALASMLHVPCDSSGAVTLTSVLPAWAGGFRSTFITHHG